jgi:DNA-binding transcriptional regulator PaaX
MFRALGKQSLDLHELFEAGGNDPQARTAVFDAVERLVSEGLLEEKGNDFYALTDKGKAAAKPIRNT